MTLATCGNSTAAVRLCVQGGGGEAAVPGVRGGAVHPGARYRRTTAIPGQRADYYIKLVHMGARWYDPQLGRWISPDTIVPDPANPQSLNRYSYVLGNVMQYVDPNGHIACLSDDCRWAEDPVTRDVMWRGPGELPLPIENLDELEDRLLDAMYQNSRSHVVAEILTRLDSPSAARQLEAYRLWIRSGQDRSSVGFQGYGDGDVGPRRLGRLRVVEL